MANVDDVPGLLPCVSTDEIAPLFYPLTWNEQIGVFTMAFGMEHYFHHKHHAAHAKAAHGHSESSAVEAVKAADAAAHGIATAAAVEPVVEEPEAPLPSNISELASEVRALRNEVTLLRKGMSPTVIVYPPNTSAPAK